MSEGTVRMTVSGAGGTVGLTVASDVLPAVPIGVQGGGTLNVAAKTAERLAAARQIALSGDAAGSAAFDGSQDINIATAVERLTNEELEAMLI